MPKISTESLLGSSIADLDEWYSDGRCRPIDALDATLDQMSTVNSQINAIACRTPLEQLREAAEASAARWSEGQQRSPLDGVPVTVKDSINVAGLPWRHGAKPNEQLPPAREDAPPAARLHEAGAIIVGKTTMPDFGMMASGVSSLYGIVHNPWDLSMTPGGSSSGAGASLASGVAWGAVGTDIAGSVRLPAAHCGIVALKPTQGRVPHLGPSTVRSAGPMGRTVADVAEVYRVVARTDMRDTFALPAESDSPIAISDEQVADLRVAVITGMGYGFSADAPTLAAVEEVAELLKRAGATVEHLNSPLREDAYDALDVLYQVHALGEYLTHPVDEQLLVHPAIREWMAHERTADLSAGDYEAALLRVSADQQAFAAVQRPYDITLLPVLPQSAFPAEMPGLNPDRPLEHCSFTAWFNQTGQPALSLPWAEDSGHPIAVQLAGPRFSDRTVLAVGSWIEARRGRSQDWPLQPRQTPSRVWRADA